ncbi:hypothetical protein BXO88_03835 [Oribacterium sp. C9]|uniref:hypothetical protein n=1 Tax=Oribacterium sp. C9 TaxID=1943579 RepID=UPI0009902406|nr:hypothetical protein [Oribacterium sp. C9]OON87415.1 hypothetical protein BXO88_03835 [Oribacterium sp. C9]
MKILLKPFAWILALVLTIMDLIIRAVVFVFCLLSFFVFAILGILIIIAIVQKMWTALIGLLIAIVVGTVLFFGSAGLSAGLCNLRSRILSW